MEIVRKNQFKKDYQKALKQGKDVNKLKLIIERLSVNAPLEREYKDHALKGKFKESRECHLEPDWLLIYTLKENCLILERLGSHSDLFH